MCFIGGGGGGDILTGVLASQALHIAPTLLIPALLCPASAKVYSTLWPATHVYSGICPILGRLPAKGDTTLLLSYLYSVHDREEHFVLPRTSSPTHTTDYIVTWGIRLEWVSPSESKLPLSISLDPTLTYGAWHPMLWSEVPKKCWRQQEGKCYRLISRKDGWWWG